MTVDKELWAVRTPASARPITFDSDRCIGCNRCANICQVDVFIPNPEKGKPPVLMWPGECYYCGSCVMVCPRQGAITLNHPLMNRAKFVPSRRPEDDPVC
ncbi:MAG: ferredoxin family protein [Clostridia bacterium]|nr:ferredoxin family protein [Clostridia bacterium]